MPPAAPGWGVAHQCEVARASVDRWESVGGARGSTHARRICPFLSVGYVNGGPTWFLGVKEVDFNVIVTAGGV